jgi:hypothetical protein
MWPVESEANKHQATQKNVKKEKRKEASDQLGTLHSSLEI